MNYYDDYSEEVFEDPELMVEVELPSYSDIIESCAIPSLFQLYDYIESLVFYSLLFRVLSNLAQRFRFQFLVHIISIVCGNLALLSTIGTSLFYCIAFIYTTFIIFLLLMRYERHTKGILGYLMGCLCLMILTLYELLEWKVPVWRQIRGILMVITMKNVSLAFDLDANVSPINYNETKLKQKLKNKPDIISYLGYIFCPTNCVLGPWTSYKDYMLVAKENKTIDRKTMFWTCLNLIFTLTFAVSSNCFVSTLAPEQSSKWIVAYRDALSFRCSHYFISHLSQLTMVMGGFADRVTENFNNNSRFFGYQVVKPLSIEFPRSLTMVVSDWNIPIHNWLKKYVFRTVRRKSVTLAIFLTYLVSSLLHGMNLQIAAVLLSLGLFSLAEHNLRKNVAESLSACVRAYPCSNCNHSLKTYSPITIIINVLFSGFTVVHLAFLGIVFNISATIADNEEDELAFSSAWKKWNELNFISYWICFGYFICDILIKV